MTDMTEKTPRNDRANKTLICCVLFVDIVSYSPQPISEQMALKTRLDRLIAEAIKDIAENDRILVDTGDGAALCFLGEPEDALFVAIHLRDLMGEEDGEGVRLSVRMGINLGPVRTINDINNRLNVIGDGINVAQRVMSFAAPDQILVSRSYYEMVSRLSPKYANLFHYLGVSRDKQVREHEIYEVSRPGASGSADAKTGPPTLFGVGEGVRLAHAASAAWPPGHLGQAPEARRRLATAAKIALATLAVGFVDGGAGISAQPGPSRARRNARRGPRPARRRSCPRRPRRPRPRPRSRLRRSRCRPPRLPPNRPSRPPARSLSWRRPLRRTEPAAATLVLGVVPWGEIYVDGKKRGLAPPLSRLKLAPGKHSVKIVNGAFPTHFMTVELKPGQTLVAKFQFK